MGKNRSNCHSQLGQLNDFLSGKKMFIRLTLRVFVNIYQFVDMFLFPLVLKVGCEIDGISVKGRPCGSVAQLAECSHGKLEALGSSPGRATIFPFPVTFGGGLLTN